MPRRSSIKGKTLKARPANAFGAYDSIPFALVDINRASKEELIKHLRIRPKVAD
jgi:hypothetical protein